MIDLIVERAQLFGKAAVVALDDTQHADQHAFNHFGLMLLAQRLVTASATVLTQSPAVRELLAALSSDLLLEITLGIVLTVLAYSSLAIVLLTATLASTGVVPMDVALGLVMGANLGSGLLAMLSTLGANVETRQVPLGNFFFKVMAVLIIAPLAPLWLQHVRPLLGEPSTLVVLFHLSFNLVAGVLFISTTHLVARWVGKCLPPTDHNALHGRISHLDPSALATPSVAISCAVRESLHQAEVVESMLVGMLGVIKSNDRRLAEQLRALDDKVDHLYSSIKYYLTKISREALSENESRRWTDIISFTINMEQVGDIVERVLVDIEDRKINPGREFSSAGMNEIIELHTLLLANLRLGTSVFLNGNVRDAQKLIEEKSRFRDLERTYASTHMTRLSINTVQSVQTSSLHLDLISDLKRINSHICSIAYPILDSAGALAPDRLRHSVLDQHP